MAITSKPINEVQPPNNLNAETEGAVALPNSLTSETEGQVGLPNSLTSETEGAVGLPNSLTSEALSNPAAPNSLTTQAASNPTAPNSLSTQPAAGFPRSLTPLVDMHFDTESYSQNGNSVSFDDLFTYSRPSSATFINRRIANNGGYEYFLDTDFVGTVTNLFTYSEQFENSDWTKQSSIILSNIANSPKEAMTADKMQASSTATTDPNIFETIVTVVSNKYTSSFFVKKDDASIVQISYFTGDVANNPRANFNVNLGILGDVDSDIEASISDQGNGWMLITSTVTALTTSTLTALRLIKSSSDTRGQQNDWIIGEGVFVWGAQMTESLKVQPYVKTISTSASDTFTESLRIEYNPETGENLGGKHEGPSTNLITKSEEMQSSDWTKTGVTTSATINNTKAPDETTSADFVVENSSTSEHFVGQTIASVIADNITTSCYVKSQTGDRSLRIRCGDSGGFIGSAHFDLSTGQPYSVTSGLIAKMIDFKNGWYRCSVKWTTLTNTNLTGRYHLMEQGSTVSSYLGNGSSGLNIWGAQLEENPLITSYIRTESSTVARAADSLMFTSNWTGGDLTVFAESTIENQPSGGSGSNRYIFDMDESSASALSYIRASSGGGLKAKHGTIEKSVANFGNFDGGFTTAFVYSNNLITTYLNGLVATFESDAGDLLIAKAGADIGIGVSRSGSNSLFGHVKKLTMYDSKLTDQEVSLL